MNVIFLSQREGRARQLNLTHPVTLIIVATLALGILGTAFALGMQLGQRSAGSVVNRAEAPSWAAAVLNEQKAQIAELRSQLQERVDAIAIRIGHLNAHLIRIDALGKRLTEMADIDHREFDFESPPAVGGPEESGGVGAQIPDLTAMLNELEQRVQLRDAQLSALESVILTRELNAQIRPEGRPVRQGFISSYFGKRQDPFTGRSNFHGGVDFAGVVGSEVVAVAAGVVTWAGERSGYGTLIEVNHGNGYVTRYAHNRRSLVNVGDTVTRGQAIAEMGSTGRSTGPHVHFEVLRSGKQVDPLTFVRRQAARKSSGSPAG